MAEAPELFDDVFIYILQFHHMAQQQHEAFQPSYRHVRERIRQALAQAKGLAGHQSIPTAEFDEALFAVEAWADERILKHQAWNHYEEWARKTLVYEDYHNVRAGVEFFQRLAQLPAHYQESRKVYHRCLALGFTGFHADDPHKLVELRYSLAQQFSGEG